MLILINGYKGSGKSTAADFLVENHGFKRVKMADALKNMMRALLKTAGIPEEDVERYVEGSVKEKETPLDVLGGQTARFAMQTLGTEWRNMIYVDLWSNIMIAKAKELMSQGNNVVCDDFRFEAEYNNVNKQFQNYQSDERPKFVKIVRSSLLEAQSKETHLSELPLHDKFFDRVIFNNGTIDDLNSTLSRFVS